MRTDCRMFGMPSLTGTYNYQRLSGTPIFLTHEWGNRVLGMGGNKVYKWTLNNTVDATTAAAYGKKTGRRKRGYPNTRRYKD